MTDIQPAKRAPDPAHVALTDALRVSFRVLTGIMILLSLAYLGSGIFIVREHERAYVLVFGQIAGVGADRIKGPGLHWTWPKPISEIVRVPAERIQSIEVDSQWYESIPLQQWQTRARAGAPFLRPLRDGYLLTGDANIAHSRWAVHYTVGDPEQYLFGIAQPERLLRWELDRAVIRVAQQWPVDQLLRTDIEGFRTEVGHVLRQRLSELDIGLDLQRLDLVSVAPPLQVAAAFEAVIEAEQDRSRAVSAARAYAARVENETQGQVARLRSEAEAAQQRIISQAAADADLFLSVRDAVRENPQLITHSIWQNRVLNILAQVDRQQFVYERDDGQRELRLRVGP